jgi:hypothetical protein
VRDAFEQPLRAKARAGKNLTSAAPQRRIEFQETPHSIRRSIRKFATVSAIIGSFWMVAESA